ncbi:hypothetical protein [Streptomyces sp. NPDC006285]|uniref:hypothetical protein n=1 Tax=Streptomyces sp. NPDC006285 TaxID=3364742 RepID=UPI00369D2221
MQQATQPTTATASPEKTRAQQVLETTEWFHDRCRAIAMLCDGRPLDHLLSVHEVLAALDGRRPTQMPLTMTWDGTITEPDGDGPGETTLIPCETSRGGRTVLALTPDQRLGLGAQLLATLHSAETCPTPGCGMTDAEIAKADPPALPGWVLVEVASLDGPPRWWCSPACVHAALTAAAAELAAADQTAATDPAAQDPRLHGGALAEFIADAHGAEAGCDADAPADEDDPDTIAVRPAPTTPVLGSTVTTGGEQ